VKNADGLRTCETVRHSPTAVSLGRPNPSAATMDRTSVSLLQPREQGGGPSLVTRLPPIERETPRQVR
jgi:hypothetical protein